MNPQFEENDELQSIIEELSANERYLLVYFKPQQFKTSSYKTIKPYILVYKNDDEKEVESLINDFAIEKELQQFKDRIEWYLQGGFELHYSLKIKDIKKNLRKDNINGLMVFGWIGDDKSYVDECAIANFIENQQSFNNGVIQVPFHLPTTNNYILYLQVTVTRQKYALDEIKNQLCIQIKRFFGVNTNPANIQIVYQTNKKQRKAEVKDITNFVAGFSSSQKFVVIFKDKMVLKQPARQNNSVIVIKGQGINSNKLYYDDIKHKKVIDVLSTLKYNQKWHQYGLKVCDIAIKPYQTFEKIDKYCKNSTQTTKHFAAIVIKQGHIFETEFQKIKSKGDVDFQKIIVADKKNQVHKKDCQVKVMDRAKKTSHIWFKDNLKNVKPILLYTSQLKVKGSQGTSTSIYRSMNNFLRDQQFCKIDEKDYQKWEFRFATQLLSQLNKIPQTKQPILWRGVGYVPKHVVGEEVLFKQFNSSSTEQKIAKKFAWKAIYKITNAKSAHQIKEYSYYESQDEVLFEPYVTLKIDKISQITNEVLGVKITLFQAHQVEKQPLPDNKSLFILWVDDKTNQGKLMWQRLVQIQKTTVMIQLLTTEELSKWLGNNKPIVEDQSVQMVMITNMKRIEGGKPVQKAGVYAVDTFLKFKPNSSIFVYIGWIQGAVAKLKQHKYVLSQKLIVDNNQNRLKEFLKTMGLK